MSCTLSADVITVAGLELALLGLVTSALYRDSKLPAFRNLKWVRRIRWPRTRPIPIPKTAAEPLTAQAVAAAGAHIKATATVRRGELTMGLVTGGYATVVGASYAILDSAYGLQGWQATLMTLDTLLLGYLFFFSGWWRNRVLLPLNERIRRD